MAMLLNAKSRSEHIGRLVIKAAGLLEIRAEYIRKIK